MSVYLISYDLNKTKDYPKLYEFISGFKNLIRPLDSVLIIDTPLTESQLNQMFNQVLDNDDTYLIIKVAHPSAGRLNQKYWDWLNAHLEECIPRTP